MFGDSNTLQDVIEKDISQKLMKRDSRWNLVLTDFNSMLATKHLEAMLTFLELSPASSCKGEEAGDNLILFPAVVQSWLGLRLLIAQTFHSSYSIQHK